MRPIIKQSNVDKAKSESNSNEADPPAPVTAQTKSQPGKRIQNRINRNTKQTASIDSVAPRTMLMGLVSLNDGWSSDNASKRSKSRLSDRLTPKKSLSDRTSASSLGSNDVAHQRQEVINSQTENTPYDELELTTPTEALLIFCDMKGYPRPTYKRFRTQKTHVIQCHVMVNKVIFSTYPTKFGTELDARIGAARTALQEMKKTELTAEFEVCTDTVTELAFKIRDCIPSSRGVFQKKIPDLFEKMHKLTLPENWREVLTDYPQLFTSEDGIGDKIIYKFVSDPTCQSEQ